MPDAPTNFTDSEVLEELVAAAAAGDRGAQQHLLAQYWPVILQAVRARKHRMGGALAAREDTQDLQQAAALRVLQQLTRHRWQGSSAFAAWIKTLARLEVVDAHRHHHAGKRDVGAEARAMSVGGIAAAGASNESRFDAGRRLEALLEQVQALKPEYATALLMHHMGFSHAEIGDTLGCTAEAARKLVSRARTRLLKAQDTTL